MQYDPNQQLNQFTSQLIELERQRVVREKSLESLTARVEALTAEISNIKKDQFVLMSNMVAAVDDIRLGELNEEIEKLKETKTEKKSSK